jgi:8-oxo-dGTP pyrophosphatase MutT (NUDIX family)
MIDSGESSAQTAVREVREEGGVDARIIGQLQTIRYFFRRGERRIVKTVDFYLMTYEGGDPALHDDEVEEAEWHPLSEPERLTYDSERKVVEEAATLVQTSAI